MFAETMPSEMGYDYIGMSFQEQKAAQGVSPAAIFGLSFLFVFLILAALYESWSLPFSVLLGTPIAVFGAFAALLCREMVNNVYAQIGLVMLIGLAAKNAILIVEFARLEYEKGKPLIEATLTGARLRLRPILMTSFAFIFGSMPLWFATGAGAVSRRVLGTVVVGGMLAATCVAVCLIPVTFGLRGEKCSLRQPPPGRGAESSRKSDEPRLGRKRAMSVQPSRGRDFLLLISFGAALLAGCAVGPNYHRPPIESPPVFRGDNAVTNVSFAELDWWGVYRDPALQTLVREAFVEHRRICALRMSRVEQARAIAAQARSQFFPSVKSTNGTATAQGRNALFGSAYPNGGATAEFSGDHASTPSGK